MAFALATISFADVPLGDSNWKNNSGHKITVSVEGGIHGDQIVTINEGTSEGVGKGTPTDDGKGCEDSSIITVGDERYKIKKGTVRWENPDGKWIKMRKDRKKENPVGV